ncbi:MAG: hypothetical protein WCG60_00525 [bacterium]
MAKQKEIPSRVGFMIIIVLLVVVLGLYVYLQSNIQMSQNVNNSQAVIVPVTLTSEDYYNKALKLFSEKSPCGDSDDEIIENLSNATRLAKGSAYSTVLSNEIKNSKLYNHFKSNLNFREAIGDLDPKTWAGLENSLSDAVFFGPQPGVAVAYILTFSPEGKLEYYTPFNNEGDYESRTEIWTWKIVSAKSGGSAQVLIKDIAGKQFQLDLTKVYLRDGGEMRYFLLTTEEKMRIKNGIFMPDGEPSYSNTDLNQCSA